MTDLDLHGSLRGHKNGKHRQNKRKLNKVGAGKKAGETVTNSTGCIYNARGLHSIQLMTFSYVAVA